ncbi:microtubule-associated protein 4 isoform X2 [Python bivittatus]|uniref:Microtubule-associated protein n=1 Tax=Python bivittatus TaxID=176946 RepID=A0A9F2WG23_PYTBI|nr:microtubule-associated protein 4 isoform X2 [Python bivittatus]
MAGMEHNLSLADALSEPPPQIEEEVKRDFIASLEAEKFDDVIGEKVGKTDYVPLLDDDDPDAGNQEAKAKPRAENVPRERPSATGPAAVVENGDHGLEGNRKGSPGKIMDEQMPYKEFLDHNDSWTVDDGNRCFDSQLAFKPMDVAEPFKMHREDVLSDLLLLPQEMMDVPTFGEYFGAPKEVHGPYGTAELPEQPPLGLTHSPGTAFDPLAFLGAEPLPNPSEAASARQMGPPEDFWLGTQHLMEGQEATFFEPPEPCKVPDEAERHPPVVGGMDFPGVLTPPEANQAASAAVSPPVGGPGPTMEELMGFEPSFDHKLLPPKGLQAGFLETAVTKEQKSEVEDTTVLAAGGCPMLEKQEEGSKFLYTSEEKDSQPLLSQHPGEPTAIIFPTQKADEAQATLPFHTQEEESKFPNFRAEDLDIYSAQHIEKVDESKLSLTQQMQEVTNQLSPAQKADGLPLSPTQKVDAPPLSPLQKVDGPPLSPVQKAGEPPLSPAQKADGPPLSPLQKVDGPPLSPAQKAGGPPLSPAWIADGPPLSPVRKADTPPLSPAQKAVTPPLSPAQKAVTPPLSPAWKADTPPLSPAWKADGPPLSPAQKADTPPLSPARKADTPPLSPTQHAEKVGEIKVPLSQFIADQEVKSPSLPSQPVEHLPGQEKLDEKNRQPPSTPTEKLKEHSQPAPTPGEHLPDPAAESVESVLWGKTQADSPGSFVEESSFVKAKEPLEPHPAHPVELPREKLPPEHEGAPPAQIRQANKSSDHRRFGRAKPAQMTVADAPEELLAGSPTQKSHSPRGDPFYVADFGSVSGTSPHSKRSQRKGPGQPFEVAEGTREILQEGWDLEASAALKKKKKKPKQKRGQQLRVVETWEDNSRKLRTPLAAAEPQKALHESAKEVSWASTEIPGKDTLKLGKEGQLRDGQHLPPLPPTDMPGLQIEGPSRSALDTKPGELSQAKSAMDDSLALQPKSKRGELSDELLKHHIEQNKQESPTSPLAQTSPGEISPFGKNVQLEPLSPKNSNIDASAQETKSAAMQKIEVPTVEPVVASEKVAPGWQGLERDEGLLEKPKKLEGALKNDRAGMGGVGLPAEPKMAEATEGGSSLHRDREGGSVASEIPKEREAKGSLSTRSEKPDFNSAKIPLVAETKLDPAKPFFAAEAIGGGPVPFTSTTEEVLGTTPPEQPAGPKKRGSDGKSKRVKHFPEPRLFPSEEKAGLSKASAAVEVEAPGEISLAARGPEESFPTSSGAREKPKKRSSNGKSRKAEERSSFRQPFFSSMEGSRDFLPSQQGWPDQTKQRADYPKEGTDILAASQLLESAADAVKQHSPPPVTLTEHAKGAPAGSGERVDLPPSAYPFILEAPGKQTECQALTESTVQTKETGSPNQNKGLSLTGLESPPGGDPTLVLPTSKPKKRSSDGKSKKSEKSSSEQPLFLEKKSDVIKPSKKTDVAKETGSPEKSQVPELPGATEVHVPAEKLLEKTGGNQGKSLCFEQLPTPEEKPSTAKTEELTKTKETPSSEKGQEANLEQFGEGTPKPHVALPQVPEELKIQDTERQSLQVPEVLEVKPEPSGEHHKLAKTEEVPSSDGSKEEASQHLLKDAKPTGQVPAKLFVDETFRGEEKGKSRQDMPSLEQSVHSLGRSDTGTVLDAERKTKTKGSTASRSSKQKKDGGSDLSDQQAPLAKPEKKGSEKKSKKALIVPPQPGVAQTKEEVNEEQPCRVGGLDFTVGEAEVVDENRNIKGFPSGHQLHWEEDLTNVFEPASALDETTSESQGTRCPFLEHPSKFADVLSKEQLFLPKLLQDPEQGDQKILEELQENLAKLEGREAVAEASLLMKAGDEIREKRKKSKRAPADRLFKPKTEKDQVSSLIESGGINLCGKIQGSPEVVVEEKPKMAPVLVAEIEGSGSVGEASDLPMEMPTLKESGKENAILQAITTALDGGSSEPGTLAENRKEAELRTSECPDSSGSKTRTDKPLEDVPVEEVGSAHKPKVSSDHLEPDDGNEAKISPIVQPASKEEAGLLGEATEPKDVQNLGLAAREQLESISPAVADHGDQGPRETKKAGRARAPQQMKGYMRPTKSRGLPPPPPPPSLRDAVQEQGRRRPAKSDAPVLHRQEKEEVKGVAEVAPAEDTAVLPSKDLPPSPEKKAKPSATAPAAKPATAKARPGPAGAPPAKRPAPATPGQSKKATVPATGPSAAATPKRPATSVSRPSSLTPREVKPKGPDVKSPEKRVSPSKPPSAATPRPSVKTSPATPRPSVLATSGTSPSPRSTAASPPKKPSTIKTEVKAADARKTTAKSPTADPSRPKSAPASTTPSPAPPGTAASRPKAKPATPKPLGTASTTVDSKKASAALKAVPKTSPVPKPPRPPTSVSVPDLKNVRSKIGSTDNIKHQPGGGKAKVERKAESAGAARKPELNAVSKMTTSKTAVSKEGAQKLPNGKVQIVSKKANYSHVQSKCGSKDNIKHVPGGGNVPNAPKPASGSHSQPSTAPRPSPGSTNVQILNKKIDLSKVSSKCGSKTNIKHKPGGGDIKIENQKLNFKEKAQAKVGSLDNVGHVPAGGTVKTEGGEEAAPENGAAATVPPSGSSAPQENGAGPTVPPQGNGDQREIQCFNTHIQETN